jgi:type VI secretion system secreted protein VgrG
LHWTSGSDLHMTAGQSYSSVAANAATLFSREGGIKAIAGNGSVTMQANTGELEILADKEVVVVSVNDGIEINANKKIVLHAGQSSITLEGGDITFSCPGNFTVKAAKHEFQTGASIPAELSVLPDSLSKLNNYIALDYRDADGDPMAGVKYKIKFEGGKVITGVLNDMGQARHEDVPERPLFAEYEMREPTPEKPWSPLAEMVAKAESKFQA